jgi:hypothetical protein
MISSEHNPGITNDNDVLFNENEVKFIKFQRHKCSVADIKFKFKSHQETYEQICDILDLDNNFVYNIEFGKCKLIKYTDVKKSVDKKDSGHVSTLFIFPPTGSNKNGSFYLCDPKKKIAINNWTIINIPINHCFSVEGHIIVFICTVFKHKTGKFDIDKSYNKLVINNIEHRNINEIKSELNKLNGDTRTLTYSNDAELMKLYEDRQREIHKINVKYDKLEHDIKNKSDKLVSDHKSKITKLTDKLDSINTNGYSEWKKLIDNIKSSYVTTYTIILNTYYRYPTPDILNESDKKLFNGVLYMMPHFSIQFRNTTGYYDDEDLFIKDDVQYATINKLDYHHQNNKTKIGIPYKKSENKQIIRITLMIVNTTKTDQSSIENDEHTSDSDESSNELELTSTSDELKVQSDSDE